MFKCIKSFFLKRKLSKIKRKIDAHYYAAVEFQRNGKFEWIVKSSKDWETRPNDCFQTKYESKSIMEKRKPSWFVFKKTKI